MTRARGDESFPKSIDLRERVVERVARVDDDVGDGQPILITCLCINAVLGGCSVVPANRDKSLDPLLSRRMHDDDLSELGCRPGLDKERHVVDHDGARVGRLNRGETLLIEAVNLGVHNRVEVSPSGSVREHQRPQCGAVESSVRRENGIPKSNPNGVKPWGTRRNSLTREQICVNHGSAERRQSRCDDGFAGSDSAGEADNIHSATLSR